MTKSIYIVDDDDAVRASLHSLLSVRSDLIIRAFRSGDLFLEMLAELDPGVLLLDFHMPGSTGLDVLNAVADDSRFVAIILTGQGNVGRSAADHGHVPPAAVRLQYSLSARTILQRGLIDDQDRAVREPALHPLIVEAIGRNDIDARQGKPRDQRAAKPGLAHDEHQHRSGRGHRSSCCDPDLYARSGGDLCDIRNMSHPCLIPKSRAPHGNQKLNDRSPCTNRVSPL